MSVTTLAVAKEYLQISHNAQNVVIQLLIDGAEQFISGHLGIELATDDFEEDLPGGEQYLWPTKRPVTEVESVVDRWNDDLAMDCELVGDGRIRRADENGQPLGDWPAGDRRFHVKYSAGLEAVPIPIQIATLQLVSRAYQARSGESSNSIAGANANWGTLAGSDILEMLKPFSRRRVVGLA
jgi:hypothetical protein